MPPDEWMVKDIKIKVPLPHSLTVKDFKKVSNYAREKLVHSTYMCITG